MCDEGRCKDCGYYMPITKTEVTSICNSLPHMGAWQKWRAQKIKQVAYALKCHGKCAYQTDIVDGLGVGCEEFWRDE